MPSRRYPSPAMSAPGREGPFTPEQLGDDDHYELSNGHPIYVAPSGVRHGVSQAIGVLSLATDPAAEEVGVEVGFVPEGTRTLRAPDISVGRMPIRPGWASGAPRLAVEYADRGNDNADLEVKVSELLEAGTELLWIVRLTGPQRVEVRRANEAPVVVPLGGMLEAPGILARPLPVEALFSLERANRVALENLLERYGDDALSSLRAAVLDLCEAFGIEPTDAQRAALATMDVPALDALRAQIKATRSWA